jgi:GDP-D-mannose 3', 5'-epimerase
MRTLVAGAGGFIGGHLVKALLDKGEVVYAVDIKMSSDWWQLHTDASNKDCIDLQDLEECREIVQISEPTHIYNLAADMGGIGFTSGNKSACMLSSLINTHLLMNIKEENLFPNYFYSSSACIYPTFKQENPDILGLKESDAYPADPDDGYGWEKLFSERMCRHFMEDHNISCHIARYHNIYGPHGTWTGGREKAPAAICRKVAEAVISGKHEIEIWGDGEQTRSFMYINDCIEGTLKLMNSNVHEPLNLGSDYLVTINQLVSIIELIANVKLNRRYVLDAPQGVRGRNSDNTLVKEKLNWGPSISLFDGLEKTYAWIYDQVKKG